MKINLSKKIIVLIIFLIILDLYLLGEKIYIDKEMKNIRTELLEYSSFKNENNYLNIGEFLNFSKIELDLRQHEKSTFGFIVLFKGMDCSSCVNQEVIKLNEFYTTFNTTVLGYFLNDSKGVEWKIFVKVNNFKFPIKLVNVFPIQNINIKRTPLVIAVNFENEKIINIYEPFPNGLEKRNAFYKRISSFNYFIKMNDKDIIHN